MTDTDARAQIKAYGGLISHAEESITEANSAKNSFRELVAICHRLVPKFKPRHTLVHQVVPDAQLSLWQDFARDFKERNGQEAQTVNAAQGA